MSHSNKTILKSTLMLYLRQLVILGMSLFTVRVVIHALGVVDFGIYGLLFSLSLVLGFAQNAFVGAAQRNFSLELAKGDFAALNRIFSVTFHLSCIIALLMLGLGETVGKWFLVHHVRLAADRLEAAVWAYQFILANLAISIVASPFHSLIIAHERLTVYAYVSLVEAGLKLLAACLLFLPVDKLPLFSALTALAGLISCAFYVVYCLRIYPESRVRWKWDGALFGSVLSYSGWNVLVTSSLEISNQGINIMLNLFFGPSANAARGIAAQVNTAFYSFVQNFSTALRPPITKSYARGDRTETIRLVFAGSKYSFFLMLALSLPALLIPEQILGLWLGRHIPYAAEFVQLIVLVSLIGALSPALMAAAQATRKVGTYQLIVSAIILSVLPMAYLAMSWGVDPPMVVLTSLLTGAALLVARVVLLKSMMSFPAARFWREVGLRVLVVLCAGYAIPEVLLQVPMGDVGKWVVAGCSVPWVGILILLVGMSSTERQRFFSVVNRYTSFFRVGPRR